MQRNILNRVRSHGLLCGGLLCAVVVGLAAWPVLRHPRLEEDDYRYLHLIQQWSTGGIGVVEAMTVENRWDHLWFMQEPGRIRFFRPTVVLSYAIDAAAWGDAYPLGLTVTNVGIHLLCSLLAAYLFLRLLGGGLPAVLSAALFAGLAAHAECIWYVAGRTDSLAALGFLAALVLHIAGHRWWALPFFAYGFLTKEMVVVLPVLLALYDRWLGPGRYQWKAYAAHGVVALAIVALKQLALAGAGSDFVHPYLVSPLDPRFAGHLWLQFRSYVGNLLAAEITVPFADAETVAALHRAWVAWVGVALFAGMAWVLRRDKRFWFLGLLGILAWLPTSFVYLSERYLYLPSLAFCGVIGLFAASRPPPWRLPLCLMLGGFAFFQSAQLRAKHAEIALQPGSVAEMLGQIEPVRGQLAKGDHLLLANLPGGFVRAQFCREILRVWLEDPTLEADVLTMMPGQDGTEWKPGEAWPVMGAGVLAAWEGGRSVVLKGRVLAEGQPPHRIQEYGSKHFAWAPLGQPAQYRAATGLTASILSGEPSGAQSIRFSLSGDDRRYRMLVWRADCSNLNEHPWVRRKNAVVQLVEPPAP